MTQFPPLTDTRSQARETEVAGKQRENYNKRKNDSDRRSTKNLGQSERSRAGS